MSHGFQGSTRVDRQCVVKVRFVSGHAFRRSVSAAILTRLEALGFAFKFNHVLTGIDNVSLF